MKIHIKKKEKEDYYVRSNVNVSDFSGVRLVGLDVDAAVGVPEADGAIFAAAEAVISVSIEPSCKNRPLVPSQHLRLVPWNPHIAHFYRPSVRLQLSSFFSK